MSKSLIELVVEYCKEHYVAHNGKCVNCKQSECDSNCGTCLKNIHFTEDCTRGYDCPNMCYYYVCQDMYKYATEMAYLWQDVFAQFGNRPLDICPIGCGPCSEFVALEEFIVHRKTENDFHYYGFDIEKNWQELQNVIKSNSVFSDRIEFVYSDAFEYYESHPKPNVIVLNYMLSNMLKYCSADFDSFLQNIVKLFTESQECVLLVNDINIGITDKQVRYYYAHFIREIRKHGNVVVYLWHFKDSMKNYYKYGNERTSSNLVFNVPQTIARMFNTNTECHSAQLMIVKKQL